MNRWQGPGGYAHVLRVGLPLLAGMGSITAMHLTDRLFLGWYSKDALAAVMPAGAAFFLFTSFFLGTVGYVGVLIAQNIGAGRPVMVHCWGGIGRTRVIVGCWLARHGWPGAAALKRLAELRRGEPTGYRSSPETTEQRAFVLAFK